MSVAKLCAPLLALGIVLPTLSASAQTMNSFPATNVKVTIDGQSRNPPDILFINREQCLSMNERMIELEFENLGTSHSQPRLLEFWVGPTSTDCHAVAGRTWTDSVSKVAPCSFIRQLQPVDARRVRVTFSARELFSSAPDSDDPAMVCNRQQEQTLYAVPLDQQTQNPTVPQAKGQAIPIRFRVVVNPLPPPPAVSAGSGQRQVTIRWDMPPGADQLTDYNVYFDPSAIRPIGDGECTSELLTTPENEPLSEDALDQLEKRPVTDGRSYNVNPEDLGLEVGDMIPVAVTSVDLAENESGPSAVVCMQRIATAGFVDACEADPDCRGSFDSCSLSHGTSNGFFGFSLGALGLALWLRRKRSV